MTHIFNISDDIIRKIFYSLNTKTQITLKQTCKYFNIFDILYIDEECGKKLNDNILNNYRHVFEVNIIYNEQITNEGLKHLSLLQSLNVSGTKITDEGIKYLSSLQSLNVSGTKITDEGFTPLKI